MIHQVAPSMSTLKSFQAYLRWISERALKVIVESLAWKSNWEACNYQNRKVADKRISYLVRRLQDSEARAAVCSYAAKVRRRGSRDSISLWFFGCGSEGIQKDV